MAAAFNWKNEASRREQVLLGVVVLALAVVFMRMVFAPRMEAVKAARSHLDQLLSERSVLQKFLTATPVLQKTDTLYRKKGVKMKLLFGEVKPTSRTVTDLLQHLSEPSFLGGMEIQKMSFLPEVKEKGYSRTDFTINLSGSFSDLVRYLERLEQFPALFYLETVSLAAAAGQPQELNVEVGGRFFDLLEGQTREESPQAALAGGER